MDEIINKFKIALRENKIKYDFDITNNYFTLNMFDDMIVCISLESEKYIQYYVYTDSTIHDEEDVLIHEDYDIDDIDNIDVDIDYIISDIKDRFVSTVKEYRRILKHIDRLNDMLDESILSPNMFTNKIITNNRNNNIKN